MFQGINNNNAWACCYCMQHIHNPVKDVGNQLMNRWRMMGSTILLSVRKISSALPTNSISIVLAILKTELPLFTQLFAAAWLEWLRT